MIDDLDARTRHRTWSALERLTAADVHRALTQLPAGAARKLGRCLGVPASVLTNGKRADAVVRRRLLALEPQRQAEVAHLVFAGPLERIVDELGPVASDPSLEQLTAAVDAVIDEIGAALVATVLAFAVDLDFVAAPHCGHLLDHDPRLALDAIGPPRSDEPTAVTNHVVGTNAADPEKRAARRARKQARRDRSTGPAPRYKKSKVVIDLTTDDDTRGAQAEFPPITYDPRHDPGAERRAVRCVKQWMHLDYEDELVTRVVFVPICFAESNGSKERPAVVIAGSGRHHVVVRPIYSEDGLRGQTWKSVPIRDLESAGLDHESVVSTEERRVRRIDIRRTFGTLAPEDWNML